MNRALHIACLDAPAPPDYGGAIEMFYKVQALAESGAQISLHYFGYKKGRDAAALAPYVKEIYCYRRKSMLSSLPFSKPHIVNSRINSKLISRLNSDSHPVILEGIHCTGLLPYLKCENRNVVVRLHNDEAVYYKHLAQHSVSIMKQIYFQQESRLLQQHQKQLPKTVTYAALTESDAAQFKRTTGLSKVVSIPPFVPWQRVESRPGRGTYALYHGNLAVAENEQAALWLIEKVFAGTEIPLVIAGQAPSKRLQCAIAEKSHIEYIANPSDETLDGLIKNAQVNTIPDFNKTGIKLKLLHALFQGRFCVTNSNAIATSPTVTVAETPDQFFKKTAEFFNRTFEDQDILMRQQILKPYNNTVNAARFNELLYSHYQ